MNTRLFRKIFSTVALGVIALALSAPGAHAQSDSKILKLKGNAANATITRNGQTLPATEGMAIQVGDMINAGAGVDVYYQPYAGVVATLTANGQVKVESLAPQEALLDLTAGEGGNLVANIEPNKGHQFGVRTPQGVAAARGTVFNAKVNGVAYTVVTLAGRVYVYTGTFTTLGQAQAAMSQNAANVVDITPGNVMAIDRVGQPRIAVRGNTNAQSEAAVVSAAEIAVAVVAQVAQNNIGGLGSAAASELSTVVQTVVSAVPNVSVTNLTALAAANAPTQAAAVVKAAVDASAPENAARVAREAAQGAAQGVVQANNGVVDATVTARVAAIAENASQSATAKGVDAATAAQQAAQGAGAGATVALSNDAKATQAASDLISAAASGSTTGAIRGAGTTGDSQSIANAAASGAAQGGVNSGVSSSLAGSAASSGASTGASNSGTTVTAPRVEVTTPTETTQTTPPQPINPDLSVSPST